MSAREMLMYRSAMVLSAERPVCSRVALSNSVRKSERVVTCVPAATRNPPARGSRVVDVVDGDANRASAVEVRGEGGENHTQGCGGETEGLSGRDLHNSARRDGRDRAPPISVRTITDREAGDRAAKRRCYPSGDAKVFRA